MGIIQPEMGHTGITEFIRIGAWRRRSTWTRSRTPPSACGIFMAASLQAAAALQNVPYHEYQHSIFDQNLRLH